MSARIWAIALNTYREAIRQKILYALVLFTVVLILFSLFLGQLTLGADTKIIKDMGLASIMILGAIMSIFIGVGLVFKEIERKTIYTLLSKPVSRPEFILGKFFGLSMTIGLEVISMTVLLFLILSFYKEPLDFNLIKAVILIFVELCVVTAVALVFSSYSSSFMSILFCVGFLILGHMTDDFAAVIAPKIRASLSQVEGQPWDGGTAIGYILLGFVRAIEVLNLDHFAINAKVVHGVPVTWAWIVSSTFFGFCWLILLLSLAIFLFKRKDLQ